MTTTVTCGDCGQVLDEDPGLTVRPHCSRCGSTRRVMQATGTVSVGVSAALGMVRVREYVERHWRWVAVVVALAVVSVLAKWVLPLWWSLVAAVVLAGLSLLARERASARVIERERVPTRQD